MRSTHTLAELQLSPAAYAEIESKLRDAGYDHAFGLGNDAGLIDMHGIGITKGSETSADEATEKSAGSPTSSKNGVLHPEPPAARFHINDRSLSASQRLHNICDALSDQLDESPFTREEWEAIDKQTVHLENRVAQLETERDRLQAQLADIEKAFRQAGYTGDDLAAGVEILRELFDAARAQPMEQKVRANRTGVCEHKCIPGQCSIEGCVNHSNACLCDAERVCVVESGHTLGVGYYCQRSSAAQPKARISSEELESLRELANSVKAAQEALDKLQSPAAEYASSYSAGMKLCAHIGWIKTELEELRQLRTEVEHFLDHCDSKFAVRIREGGGPENLAASLATTISKIDREMSRFEQMLSPGDHSELMKRLPNVRREMVDKLRSENVAELTRRVLIQCDWLCSYSRCADGLDLTIDKRPINGSGVEGARDPRDIRRIIEEMIKKIGLKDELISDMQKHVERIDALINSPRIDGFIEAVRLEAIHQRERWGSDHDAGKKDVDWLFLVGYLGGEAVEAGKLLEKAVVPDFRNVLLQRRLHHIIAAGAAILNWHDARSGGDNKMRPGIMPPQGFSEEQAFGLPTPERTPPMPPTESGARELRAEADRLGIDIPKEVSVAGVFTVEKGAAVVKGEPSDVVREFTSETEERAARLDAAAATGSVEHYTSVVESMIEEDEAKASLREGSTVRVPGVGEL